MKLSISLDRVRNHYERKGFEFKPFCMLDIPAWTAKRGSLRIVLEGADRLTYAAMSCLLDDIQGAAMNELAELIVPDWDPVGGFVPEETARMSIKHNGSHIGFIRVPQVGRCLFSVQLG